MRQPQPLRLPLRPPQAVGEAPAQLWLPDTDARRLGVVLAPGAGGDLTNATLQTVARGLADAGHPVLLFDFGYRAAGQRRPDPAPRLLSAWADAVALAREHVGERPLVLGGRSMGGRIATLLVADAALPGCAGLVLLGYPLHPPGRREKLRTAHWPRLRPPLLFVQGERDTLCDLDVFEQERAKLAGDVDLHVLAAADHSFRVRARDGRPASEVSDEVVATVVDWVDALPSAVADPREPRAGAGGTLGP